ncbi:MAG TPA: Crp/Fnr family transcriptional regulator [Chloroflexota bacterium]|nr:Crp/Fnr family transcriptional regulator [Chloroflexota bacterium]
MAVASSPPMERTMRPREAGGSLGFLREVHCFSLLPEFTLRRILAVSATRQISRGSFVFLQDEPIAAVHLLLEGRIKVVRETEEGRVVIMRLIEPGELFGLVGYATGTTYRNSALAQTNTRILAIPRAEFAALTASNAAFAVAILDELGKRLGDAEGRIQDLQTERAACRIARVLLKLFGEARCSLGDALPTLPLSRQDLADLCGTNLSTASRTVSEWEQHGIVDAGRERVKLLRPRALAAIAGARA